MVVKEYLADPYRSECEAKVVDVRDGRVFLSNTVFFPEGGGQIGDIGTIGDSVVCDARKTGGLPFSVADFPMIMVGGDVAHVLDPDARPPSIGADVPVRIDWQRRYRIMRHHSAAHLAYWFAMRARPDLYVKGCRIDDSSARFDFVTANRLDGAALVEWQESSNQLVSADVEISNAAVGGEPEALMWYCGQMQIPCGGTHVRSTAEIGQLRLRRKRQGNNLERLYISLTEVDS